MQINRTTVKLMRIILALILGSLALPALALAGSANVSPSTSSYEPLPTNAEPVEPDAPAYLAYGSPLEMDQPPVRISDSPLPEGVSENWWGTVQDELRQENTFQAALISPATWTADGENTDDRFGFSVAEAGDVNGDGFADVVVGAYQHNSNTGKVYLYHGTDSGGSLSTTPSLTITGENGGDKFGYSVAGAGDVNGDGYSDVLVGAYAHDGAKGKVYAYYGSGSGLSATPSFTATGNNYVTPDNLGRSVAGAGDFNGDGYADIIVGASGFNSFSGYFIIYWGSASGPDSSFSSAVNGLTGSSLGYAVSGAGDVNGDGFADVIVGAWQHNSSTGQAYIYHGSASGINYPPQSTLSGEGTNNFFGISVAEAGDVNGDGYSDVLVGAYAYNSFTGRAYLYYGSSTGVNTSPAFTATGKNTDDFFSLDLAGVGDVNGDGYGDVMIGGSGGSSSTGQAFLYQGSSSGLSATPVFTASGGGVGGRFGRAIAGAGDVNGDGYADVIIGAWDADSVGQTLLYQGSGDTLNPNPAFTITGENANDSLGASVAGVGDVNGDGFADVLVGAEGYDNYRGRVYLYHGNNSGLSATPDLTADGENTDDNFGDAVAGAGDVNGDGFADVLVGAGGHNNYRGRVYLYRGSDSGLSASPTLTVNGENNNDNFGSAVAGVGDVNGDGFADVMVGAVGYNSDRGRVYLYYGSGSGLSATPAFTATGEAAINNFGSSVVGVGDVNGDGFADVMVGAYGYNNYRGRVYLYHGSASGLNPTPAFTADGEAVNDRFGGSGAGVGDINGDGYADVIVGASGYDSNTGRVYLYHGSGSGLNPSPAFTATGKDTSNLFGTSLAGAGDVNGDGFADVLVGADGYNSNKGRVYLYQGSSSGLSATPAFTATGENNYNRFGDAVAGAGDVNGDGFADALVGADEYDDGGFDHGRAYLYLGNQAGRKVLAQQYQGGGFWPVQSWGLTYQYNKFQVKMTATSPRGREQVKLEVEVCPSDVAFGVVSCKTYTSSSWSDATATSDGVSLTLPVDDLTVNTLYRWRGRVLYAPYTVNETGITSPPNPAHSPWRRFNGQTTEADIRVGTMPEITVKGNGQVINDGDITPQTADLTDFGAATLGTSINRTFTIKNDGGTNISLSGNPMVSLSTGTHFSLSQPAVSILGPSESTTFVVTFTASGIGSFNETITIANNDDNENPYNFAIKGTTVTLPEIEVEGNGHVINDGDTTPSSADHTDFGTATIGTSINRTFTIKNTGGTNLNLTGNPMVSLSTGMHFSLSQPAVSTLAPGESTTFVVTFTPSGAGTLNNTITIANNDDNENPYNFAIEGTAVTLPEIEVKGNGQVINDGDTSPSSADHTDFGTVTIGTSINRTFTIKNTGGTNLNLTGNPMVSLSTGTHFSLSQPAVSILGPGESTTFVVTFTASGVGSFNETITIANNDDNENPYNFAIKGTAVTLPEIEVKGNGQVINNGDTTPQTADHTDFGTAAIGTSINRTFTIKNTGGTNLNLTGNPMVSLSTGTHFSLSQPAVSTLAPGESTTFVVTFTPSGAGSFDDTITIANNDDNENPYTFMISGVSIARTYLPIVIKP